MTRYLRKFSVIMGSAGVIVLLFSSCFHTHKYELMIGDNLTPLGCFVFGPWEAHADRQNVAIFIGKKELSSKARFFSKAERDFTFELTKDGSVRYWFKSDYDSSLIKRLSPDKNGEVQEGKYKPQKGEIKKIYKGDHWEVNYTDSSVSIYFGKNNFGLMPVKGKYTDLGSGFLELRQTTFFDSTYDSKPETYRRVVTTLYSHPYLNKFDK